MKIKSTTIKLIAIIAAIITLLCFTGCTESCARSCKSCSSDWNGGLSREIIVYSMTGQELFRVTGKFDIEENSNGTKVLFDLDGKRYVFYNCSVIVIEQ